jgi:hypothetical protein
LKSTSALVVTLAFLLLLMTMQRAYAPIVTVEKVGWAVRGLAAISCLHGVWAMYNAAQHLTYSPPNLWENIRNNYLVPGLTMTGTAFDCIGTFAPAQEMIGLHIIACANNVGLSLAETPTLVGESHENEMGGHPIGSKWQIISGYALTAATCKAGLFH